MKLAKLIYVLFRIKLLSLTSIFRLAVSIYTHGINLLALLSFSAKSYRAQPAVEDECRAVSYEQLYTFSLLLSEQLRAEYGLAKGSRVAIICRNHSQLMTSIYAVSGTGADLFLLNTELANEQLLDIVCEQQFDLVIVDDALIARLADKLNNQKIYNCSHPEHIHVKQPSQHTPKGRSSFGKLVLFTGGTTGKAKQAAHKPSLYNYLDPFYSFIMRLQLNRIGSAYIATPIYHGYGIAVMLLCHALGKKLYVTEYFETKRACQLIESEQIEMITVVPIMLQRLLQESSGALRSLKCIASGGAELSPKLAEQTLQYVGSVLYNLYGTSEAGLNMIATPDDLQYDSRTIGTPISGGKVQVLNERHEKVEGNQIGQICIKNSWSMFNRTKSWIETGDLAYRDKTGRFYLYGRTDSMIVSGGENVYPYEIEQLLLTHPSVEDVAVIAVSDEQFGQRLSAYVIGNSKDSITEEELLAWMKPKLARFQMPRELYIVDTIPYTSLGKKDKKQLRELYTFKVADKC